MNNTRSDAYAVVALAWSISATMTVLLVFLGTFFSKNSIPIVTLLNPLRLSSSWVIPIAFGIVGLKSPQRKVAIASLALVAIDIFIGLFVGFVLPIIGIIMNGPG